jgi:hypothetical protein
MEILQTIQYQFVNECDNPINVALTEVAYIFVLIQPLMWNIFFYMNSASNEKLLFLSGIAMASLWVIFNILGRILYTPENGMTKKDSYLAGNKTCTYRDMSHLYWKWPIANLGDLNATSLMFVVIWFIPALLSITHRTTGLIIAGSATLSLLYAYSVGQVEVMTSAWCYISIPLSYMVFGKTIFYGK